MRKIKVLSFIISVGLITSLLHFLLVPSSYLRVVLHEVQDTSVNYDLIFIGQSMGETNINPYIIETETGKSSYNMCRRIISMPDLYYLVKECNYRNDMQKLVLVIDPTYWYGSTTNYYNDAYMLPHLNSPRNKIEYFFRYTIKTDYRVFFSRYVLHGKDDIFNCLERVRQKTSDEYKNYDMRAVSETGDHFNYIGRGFRYGVRPAETYYTGVKWGREYIDSKAVEAFEEIVYYCQDNDIELICINSPFPHERFNNDDLKDMKAFYSDVADNYHIGYMDFNFIKPIYLQWQAEDFEDGEGHMMGEFAEEYSKVLGTVLDEYFSGNNIDDYFSDFPNTEE